MATYYLIKNFIRKMSLPENGRPALSAEEPGKLSAIPHRQLADWYAKREVSTDSKVFASGVSHCNLLAKVFPASLDVKKMRSGYFSVVAGHNWKLFTTGMDRLGVKKVFNVAKLQIPNSVEMQQAKVWMKAFVEMNEEKFSGMPMENRPGADMKHALMKRRSEVSVHERRSSIRRSNLFSSPAQNRETRTPVARRSSFLPKPNVSKPVPRVVAKPPVKKDSRKSTVQKEDKAATAEKKDVKVVKTVCFEKLPKQEIAILMENGELTEELSRVSCNLVNTEDLELTSEASELVTKEILIPDVPLKVLTVDSSATTTAMKTPECLDKTLSSETTEEFSVKEASEEFLQNAASLFTSIGNVDVSYGRGVLLSPVFNMKDKNKEDELHDTPIPGKGLNMMFVRTGRGSRVSPINDAKKEFGGIQEVLEEEIVPGKESPLSLASTPLSEIHPFDLPLPQSSPEESAKGQGENSPLNIAKATKKLGDPYNFEELRKALENND